MPNIGIIFKPNDVNGISTQVNKCKQTCTMDAEKIDDIVRSYDDNITLKEKQREALLLLANSRTDVIVNLPVGYGKSIIYHLLPKILGEDVVKPVVLVISPLNIIQKDQRDALKQHNISCCRLDINANVEECDLKGPDTEHYTCVSDSDIGGVVGGDYSVVLCHPEALLNTKKGREITNSTLQQHVVAVVIDECHVLEEWGDEFRTAFRKLKTLKAFFPNIPFVALSATLTSAQKKELPNQLGLCNHRLIEASPDKPNIYLEKYDKGSSTDVEAEYEDVTHALCDRLYKERENFPVTLIFLPVFYMSQVLMYLNSLFKAQTIDDALYSAICSGQDKYVIDKTVNELKKKEPRIRLVLTTSILGMGFDPENVTNVVHACPPRNISQYFQEIGRAGRRGQASTATLFYSSRNIAKNLPGIKEDIISYCKNQSCCLRNQLLSVFEFEKDISIEDCKCCSFCKKSCICEKCFPMHDLCFGN